MDIVSSEVKAIKQTIERIGQDLKGHDTDKENDNFYQTFQNFQLSSKKELENLINKLENCVSEFKNLSAYYGEDNVDEKSVKHFFSVLTGFAVAFEVNFS